MLCNRHSFQKNLVSITESNVVSGSLGETRSQQDVKTHAVFLKDKVSKMNKSKTPPTKNSGDP